MGISLADNNRQMNLKKFDIAIIGGGPAGSSAGILLSKKGYSVSIIEKKTFPREVLCGEFISKEVVEFLKVNFLFEEFIKLSPNIITSFRFTGENGKELLSLLEFPAYGIRRSKLDSFFLNKARENGAEIYQPAEVKEIQKQAEGYVLKIKSEDRDEFTLNCKIMIRNNFIILVTKVCCYGSSITFIGSQVKPKAVFFLFLYRNPPIALVNQFHRFFG